MLSKTLKESETKNSELEGKLTRAEEDREQLKANLAKWTEAVKLRDEKLGKAREQLEMLVSDRNMAVQRFNELAEKYNASVEELNKRAKDFNDLVENYNHLVQNASK